MTSNHTLTRTIKAKAFELGFSSVGVARAEALEAEGVRLQQWLSRGYHGTMEWMQKNLEKRNDLRQIVPNALSVVSLALNYYTPVERLENPETGKISRYAWGDDYHIVMTSRIQQLVDCITSERPGVNARFYVDTGPVMDKAWAVRGGIGWLGKHTNVITKEYGSWVFLGEIILDLELECDEPMADFCGTCTACIQACPTGAIVEPYVLDSTKCISYLTIEHKGPIPDVLKPGFENWVYGCDICQDVCPWNRFQQPTREHAFFPRNENVNPQLNELVSIPAEEFTRRFKKSPIKRTKREGIVRNAKAVQEGKTSGGAI
ncbi:MAG: tRNA epoxyqueuosine(34) reductase QueG [Ignavibacteria bacterium]|nr:tRNA epoxyqueuosine(34) reductase QueG [Ignavibacteria bacterium]